MNGRIIIIGASGLIGSQLFRLAESRGIEVLGSHSGNPAARTRRLDLRTDSVLDVFPDLSSDDTVYLLSAYSSPGWIYAHAEEARSLNVSGTRRAVSEILSRGSHLIFMSSVEVFDGKTGNYGETARPAPLNLYGRMKLEIEDLLQTTGGESTIVRTGWNVGWDAAHRCVVKLTYESLLAPGARMAHDNTFSIADVNDTAEGLLRLRGKREVRIIHFASPEIVVRKALADRIRSLSIRGSSMDYLAVPFAEIPYTEPRARENHLRVDLSCELLQMAYRSVDEIIAAKVKLLDATSAP